MMVVLKFRPTRFLFSLILAGSSCFFSLLSIAQSPLPRITQLEEEKINVSLDGFVDEPVWASIPAIDGMKTIQPDTLEDAPYKTDIRFFYTCLLYTSPSPRDRTRSRMPSSA